MDRTDSADDVVVPRSSFGVHNLAEVRERVQLAAEGRGLSPEAAEGFVQAVSEALANALRHGGPARSIVVRSSGDRLRAEVHDNGNAQQLIIPKQMPSPEQVDGRGLWLISELA